MGERLSRLALDGGSGSFYTRRQNLCDARCAEAAEAKLASRVLDHDDPREPSELTPHRADRGQGNADPLEPCVPSDVHAVRREGESVGGRIDSTANPQAPHPLVPLADGSRNRFRKMP